jgi:hypothetical protein
MQRVSPVSLNAISYNAVIRALEKIRSGAGHEPPTIGDIFIGTPNSMNDERSLEYLILMCFSSPWTLPS